MVDYHPRTFVEWLLRSSRAALENPDRRRLSRYLRSPRHFPSKERLETLKNVAPSQFMEKLKEAMADRTTEVTMCLAYVAGIEHGWKEGHEHGVVAAEFPEGWPKDEQKSLANLPLKQLQAGQAAMKVDVPCIPDYVTIGQERDIVVKYIRDQEGKGNFLIPVAFTSRVVYLAFQQAFQCPAQPTKPPDAIQ